jgi:two-component system sensor histidine kinase MprB
MTLRVRLALILAALVTAAVGVTSVVGYVASARRLEAEVDQFLRERSQVAGYIDGLRGPYGPGRPGGPVVPQPGRYGGDRDEQASGIGGVGDGPAPPATWFGSELPRYLGLDAEVQLLDRAGSVLLASTDLPVSAADRAVAAGASPPVWRTQRVDGVPYRMVTLPISSGAVQLARDYRETEAVLASLRARFLLLGLVGAGVAAVVGWLVARQVTGPLVRLTAAAEAVASTGDLGAPVPLPAPGRDETGRLAGAFATMLAALARSREDQARLVQDAGHELRTPVTSLRTNAEVLRRYPDLAADQRDRILADIDSEAQELGQLVDELVVLASGGQDDGAVGPVDLGAVAEHVAERFRRRTGRDIDVVRADGPATVAGREAALERAVSNLVDNAAKFAPDGRVEVQVAGGRVTVRDEGPGLAAGEEQFVFDRFWRSDHARSAPGSGLGLAIVAQVAGAHGGRVFAGNRTDRSGALVGFEVPLSRGPATASAETDVAGGRGA